MVISYNSKFAKGASGRGADQARGGRGSGSRCRRRDRGLGVLRRRGSRARRSWARAVYGVRTAYSTQPGRLVGAPAAGCAVWWVTMFRMRLDHLSYAAGHEGLAACVQRLGSRLGAAFSDGGIHPSFGTRNFVLPLANGCYLEVVEALDHPAADRAPFGRAVRSRAEDGGGWLAWAIAVDDMSVIEDRLGPQGRARAPAPTRRLRPAVAPDRHQRRRRGPAAAAVLHAVGERRRAPPRPRGGSAIVLTGLEIAGERADGRRLPRHVGPASRSTASPSTGSRRSTARTASWPRRSARPVATSVSTERPSSDCRPIVAHSPPRRGIVTACAT